MSQHVKTTVLVLFFAIIAGIIAYQIPSNTEGASNELTKYYCEISGGEFDESGCECPFEAEIGQTSESMYETKTGTCQTTIGGPGGVLMQQISEQLDQQFKYNACLDELSECNN